MRGLMVMRQLRAVAFCVVMAAILHPSCGKTDDLGVLRIVTEPGDAQILIDGKRRGNSAAEPGQSFAVKLEEGTHVVEARKADGSSFEYYARREDVFVSNGTMQTITVKLARKFSGTGFEPEMVTIPAGRFRMGCVDNSTDCVDASKPVHTVNVVAFEIGKHEVTFDQWDACVADGGCTHVPDDQGWGRDNRPVINVSWNDIQTYLAWLNRKTGKRYRLPSGAEWEYAARSGTETVYWWGNAAGSNNANCYRCGSRWDDKQTAPVGSFKPNRFGLYDVHGNVAEWAADCSHDNYRGAPTDGLAWTTGECKYRVIRNGSWTSHLQALHSAHLESNLPDSRDKFVGFRVAKTLTP